MRITLARTGGLASFPGLERPMTIDTARLGAGDAAALEGAVRQVGFLALPAQVGEPAPGAADYRTYTITVEDGDRAHSVCVVEPIADPALRDLVSRIERHRGPRSA